MANLLEQLRLCSTVVADTGDLEAIKRFKPQDATTNPSLILKAVQSGQYDDLIARIIASADRSSPDSLLTDVSDHLIVAMGKEILGCIPGKVSTEVDARLSFDVAATLDKARKLMDLYEEAGIGRDRVLIKVAATWEGILAAEILQKEGIDCNLTLIFSFAQARACAEVGAFLISPFVGRVLDWYRAKNPDKTYEPHEEPGVTQVSEIYAYFKQHGYNTNVMGASFRNMGEILELAGCDRLTISPALLDELGQTSGELSVKLTDAGERRATPEPISEAEFRWQMNSDPMATEKLAEGIRGFAADQEKLEALLVAKLGLDSVI